MAVPAFIQKIALPGIIHRDGNARCADHTTRICVARFSNRVKAISDITNVLGTNFFAIRQRKSDT